MRNINWNNVQDASEFNKPVPGGYVAKITRVEDNESREFLKIEWDFAEGQYKGANADTYKHAGFWPCNFIRSYKEKALPFFKSFKTAIEKSNPGYEFQNNPETLVGKFMGVVLGEEEYQKNNGDIGTRLYVDEVRSGQAIREGDFKVPDLKRMQLDYSPKANYEPRISELDDDDEEIPF